MTANERDRQLLIESACSAWRERSGTGRILPSPAWHDLAPDEREAAYEAQRRARALEAALDPRGLSVSGRAVVERARRLQQLL